MNEKNENQINYIENRINDLQSILKDHIDSLQKSTYSNEIKQIKEEVYNIKNNLLDIIDKKNKIKNEEFEKLIDLKLENMILKIQVCEKTIKDHIAEYEKNKIPYKTIILTTLITGSLGVVFWILKDFVIKLLS